MATIARHECMIYDTLHFFYCYKYHYCVYSNAAYVNIIHWLNQRTLACSCNGDLRRRHLRCRLWEGNGQDTILQLCLDLIILYYNPSQYFILITNHDSLPSHPGGAAKSWKTCRTCARVRHSCFLHVQKRFCSPQIYSGGRCGCRFVHSPSLAQGVRMREFSGCMVSSCA